jgi:hypothetical protein
MPAIPDLPAISAIDDDDVLIVVEDGVAKKITVAQLGAALGGAVDPVEEILGAPDTAFEFETTSLSGLTALSPTPDVENADTTVPGHYYIQDNATGVACVGRYVSATSPFTAVTRLTGCPIGNEWNAAGVFIGVATPGVMESAEYTMAGASRGITAARYTSPTAFGSNLGPLANSTSSQTPLYLGIRVNSGTSVDYLVSWDGYVWVKIRATRDPAITIASAGIFMKAESAAGLGAAFDYLRIWNSAKTFPGVA